MTQHSSTTWSWAHRIAAALGATVSALYLASLAPDATVKLFFRLLGDDRQTLIGFEGVVAFCAWSVAFSLADAVLLALRPELWLRAAMLTNISTLAIYGAGFASGVLGLLPNS